MPRFEVAEAATDCRECDEAIAAGALLMKYSLRETYYGRVVSTRVLYCEDCGKLLLESLSPTGSRTP